MSSDVDGWVAWAWAAYGQLASKAFAISAARSISHATLNVSVLPYRLGAVVRKVDSAASVYAVRDKPVVLLAPEYRTVTSYETPGPAGVLAGR
jgi:hypothetical protein